jgi:hypothetical protein
MAKIKDTLVRIEAKVDELLEAEKEKPQQVNEEKQMTSAERMAHARSFRKVNTGEGGRG